MSLSDLKKFLVQEAEKFGEMKQNNLSSTQINNMIEFSNSSCCKEEIENFIKYQIGRSGRGKNWASVEKEILELLDDIEKKVKEDDSEAKDEDIVRSIMFFFGYLKRYMKFKEFKKGEKK